VLPHLGQHVPRDPHRQRGGRAGLGRDDPPGSRRAAHRRSRPGDTAALPAIWDNKADFEARFAKFSADAKEAQGSVKDLDTFKATFSAITKNCGGCHEMYRAKKS